MIRRRGACDDAATTTTAWSHNTQMALVSKTPSEVSSQSSSIMMGPRRKKRRTILDSFRAITLAKEDEEEDDGQDDDWSEKGSSCATGGRACQGDANSSNDGDYDDGFQSSSDELFLSDKEIAERLVMRKMVPGVATTTSTATAGATNKRTDVVQERIEQMIRTSRLQATATTTTTTAVANDDFHVELAIRQQQQREFSSVVGMEIETTALKRSFSLPRDFISEEQRQRDASSMPPPVDSIEVEILR